MKGKGIKVVVDYTNASYNVMGSLNGRPFSIHKPIKGVDKDGFYKANYSMRLINRRRNQIRHRLRAISKANPNFRYSRKLIDKIDPLMFKALEDWDSMAGTTYADDYIKTITQKFEFKDSPGMPRDMFEERCQKERMADLEAMGLEISYNVGLFNVHKDLNVIDIIRGMNFARVQRKLLGVDVKNSLILKRNYYLDDINSFVEDIVNEIYNKHEDEQSSEEHDDSLNRGEGEGDIFLHADKRVKSEENPIFMPEEESQEVAEDPLFITEEQSDKVDEPPITLGANSALETDLKKQVNNYFDEKKRAEEVKRIMEEEAAEKAAQAKAAKNAPHKRTIKQSHAPKSNSQKAQHYKNSGKKKRVKNHTGIRPGPTKKQRESMARKAKKEENSHYNTQMRLKAEKEAKKQAAAERIAAAQREKEEQEAAAAVIKEEPSLFDIDEIIAEYDRKMAEQEAVAKKELSAEELEQIAMQKRISKAIEETRAKGRDLTVSEPAIELSVSEITREFERAQAEKAEVRFWKRKIFGPKDSIKNKKFVHKEENKKKTIKKFSFEAVKRRVSAEVRYWKRKLRSKDDSIRNKQRIPRFIEAGKRIVIAGAFTLLAAGVIAGGIKLSDYTKDVIDRNREAVVMSTESDHQVEESTEARADDSSSVTIEIEDSEEEKAEETTATEKEESVAETTESSSEVEQEEVQEETAAEEVQEEKSEEEKMEEFRDVATKTFRDAIVIGESPNVGDLFADQMYSQNPDGTGKKGYFSEHPDYSIQFINIITNDGWHTVSIEGKNLSDLLAEYPDCITYNFHVVDSKTGGWLGFVTQEQYEQLIQNKVDSIIQSKTQTRDANQTVNDSELDR